MKFALFTHIPWPEGSDPTTVIQQTAEEVRYGEELGFHSAWLAEHHFSRYGLGSSSLVLATHIAARTSRIRLGTAVLVPTLHNPIRLAEDTATLDSISGGRLDVGFGRGSDNYEYKSYNVAWEESQERFQEAIGVIQGLWTTSDYTHKGRFFSVGHANLVPPPLQKPHPPIYIAASRTQATLEYLVSTGHPLIIGVVLDTRDALELCHRFVTLSREAGHDVPMSRIPFSRYFYVAETEREAREDTEAGLRWNLDMIQWRRTFTEGSEVHHHLDEWRRTRAGPPPDIDYIYENRAIIGTPDRCAAKIEELRSEGIEYFVCNFAFGGLDHRKLMRSMKLFAKEVMPRFA